MCQENNYYIYMEGFEFEELNRDSLNRDVDLTIVTVTYNFASYLENCLKSILSQKTKYKYEILIYDDNSTDETKEIIRKYAKDYPEVIHAYMAKENTYKSVKRHDINRLLLSKLSNGKFISYCEGDDYWIDDNKIEKQLDFLINNPEYVLSVHNAYIVDMRNNNKRPMMPMKNDMELDAETIIKQKYGMLPTASMIGKKYIFSDSDFLFGYGIGDWTIQLNAIAKGKIYYHKEIMSVYRFFLSGSWSMRTYEDYATRLEHESQMLNLLEEYDLCTNRKYTTYVSQKKSSLVTSVFDIFELDDENFSSVLKIAEKKINDRFIDSVSILRKAKMIYGDADMKYENEQLNEYLANHFQSKEIFIYCASTAGFRVKKVLEKLGCEIKGFLDGDISKIGTVVAGKKVYDIETLKGKKDYIIQVGSLDYDAAISERLESEGYRFISAHEFYQKVLDL